MNDNSSDDKVKQKGTLPFPGSISFIERLDRLEDTVSKLQNVVASLQAAIAGRESRPEIKAPVEVSTAPSAPASRPLPEEDKMVNRYALCAELVQLLTELNRETVLISLPKLAHGDKTDKPRVYFIDDNSFLYFDKWGRIFSGAPTRKCKGKTARYVLGKLYKMRDYLPSPLIQAALLKSQFNSAVK